MAALLNTMEMDAMGYTKRPKTHLRALGSCTNATLLRMIFRTIWCVTAWRTSTLMPCTSYLMMERAPIGFVQSVDGMQKTWAMRP